jgi:hypothetical protein
MEGDREDMAEEGRANDEDMLMYINAITAEANPRDGDCGGDGRGRGAR